MKKNGKRALAVRTQKPKNPRNRKNGEPRTLRDPTRTRTPTNRCLNMTNLIVNMFGQIIQVINNYKHIKI